MKRNKTKQIPATRKQLIAYIKKTQPFYRFVDFRGHSDEQLKAVASKQKLPIEPGGIF